MASTAEVESPVPQAEPEQPNGLPEEQGASEAAGAPASEHKEGQHEEDDEPWRRR